MEMNVAGRPFLSEKGLPSGKCSGCPFSGGGTAFFPGSLSEIKSTIMLSTQTPIRIFLTGFFLILMQYTDVRADDFPRAVTAFSGVNLRIPAETEWTSAAGASCVITCSAEIEKQIVVENEGNTLIIRFRGSGLKGWLSDRDRIRVRLSSPMLEKVKINGSGNFVMKSPGKAPAFKFQINGSGDLDARMESASCDGSINGSGKVKLSGKSDRFSLEIHGSGDVDALELDCKSVEVEIAGSGDAKVQVSESLEVEIAGSGDVAYKGNPKKLVQKVAGSGEIRKL